MGKPQRKRLDALLVERGLAPSRSAAVGYVLAGNVYSGEQRLDKPGTAVSEEMPLIVRQPAPYVSRGGVKLAHALSDLQVQVEGRTWVDVGSSTGGFTDCLLQQGAARVYAVDVGKGLLADKLRRDARVVSREGVNARHLTAADFPDPIDAVVVDASFIGLGKLLPAIAMILPTGGELLAMIKPQFEAGRELARKHRGVIRDQALRQQIVQRVLDEVTAAGFARVADAQSQLAGPKGNVEHFVVARRTAAPPPDDGPAAPASEPTAEP